MKPRDAMLARVREALSVRTEHPRNTLPLHELLPPVGEAFEERLALFRAHSERLRVDVRIVDSLGKAAEFVTRLAESEGWARLAVQHDPELLALGEPCERLIVEASDPVALAACDAGLTKCEALIAQTGSILVSAAASGGRTLSVLPPHHLVLARADQLLPDLPAAFTHLRTTYGDALPTFCGFITGPSRTADIERVPVVGIHGPERVTVLLLSNP